MIPKYEYIVTKNQKYCNKKFNKLQRKNRHNELNRDFEEIVREPIERRDIKILPAARACD